MIDLQNIKKTFGDKDVLNGLNLTIAAGEIYGLLGPNGAGKTTAINILCNLLDADSGNVTFNGQGVSGSTKYAIGIVPQEISVYKDLTCMENLQFFAELYGIPGPARRERIDELIRAFSLDEYADTEVAKLSGGWQRRINIAVALTHSPSALVLDEPTAGLDVEARYELWSLIKSLQSQGVTILLTTHQLDEAERLCSRIGIIHQGRITAQGSLDELRVNVPAKQLAVIETDDETTLCQKAATFGWEHRHYGGRLTFLLPQESTLKEIINKFDNIPMRTVSLQPVGLEHVYLELTGGQSINQRTDVLLSRED